MANSAGGYYPPVGFHFRVEFIGVGNNNDTRFQSVSGLTMEYDVETFKEGGENRFEHKLPGRSKFADLSLKRGMLSDSEVIKWLLGILRDRDFINHKPAVVQVSLLNEKHEPLRTWEFIDAWPKKWSVSDLNAQENSIVVETLELAYKYFKVK
ncbi:MAG: phage tail protein [Chitinophagaceae bacterium]|jgi:phage tail-like protein|nr:phage tail protein [Chitinophagaceae bacterium]MCU0403503.1 phage tail protein [Chitinophagaceae bacterium]